MNKKGIQLNQAFAAVMILVMVAILVIVAIFLFITIGGTFPDTSITTLEETFASVGAVGTATANASLCSFSAFSVTTAVNDTGFWIDPANYTVTSSTGLVQYTAADNAGGFNNSDWRINSTSNWGGEGCAASDTLAAQFGTFPVLVGLVGTIIFLGLVIGILVASFVFGRRRSL